MDYIDNAPVRALRDVSVKLMKHNAKFILTYFISFMAYLICRYTGPYEILPIIYCLLPISVGLHIWAMFDKRCLYHLLFSTPAILDYIVLLLNTFALLTFFF